jgi:hypothetical protein
LSTAAADGGSSRSQMLDTTILCQGPRTNE